MLKWNGVKWNKIRLVKYIKPLYFNNKINMFLSMYDKLLRTINICNIYYNMFLTTHFKIGDCEPLTSNIAGFNDLESHPQLLLFFYYSPDNVAFDVVVDTKQDIVL